MMTIPPPIPTSPERIPVKNPSTREMTIVTWRPLVRGMDLLPMTCGVVLADDDSYFHCRIGTKIVKREANSLLFRVTNFGFDVALNTFARIDDAQQNHLPGAIQAGIAFAKESTLADHAQ